ncbi:MAG: STAS/SEC14 domain-containing protein [Verrucomicrobiota bacterium]
MLTNITFDPSTQLCEFHIHRVLSHIDLASAQAEIASLVAAGKEPRLLVILDDFAGWEKGGNWDNLDFMFTHGTKIARIAVVGDQRWESEVKMFAGAGFRSAPVGYFETERMDDARAWVLG